MTASQAWGLGLAFLGAAIVLASGQGTRGGAAAGFVTAGLLVLGFGSGIMAPVALFVLGSGFLTRLGRATKERAGAAEPNRGRRGAAHVAAKLGVPALLGLAALAIPGHRMLLALGAVASIAAAFADTAATETGPVLGGPVVRWSGRGLIAAKHGTPGGMSLGGIAASLSAALATALLGAAVGLLAAGSAVLVAACAGFGATLVESAIAATRGGRALGHFGRNVVLSTVAAVAALGVAAFMENVRKGGA